MSNIKAKSPRGIGPDITPGDHSEAIKGIGQNVDLLESMGYKVDCNVRVKRKGSDTWENIPVNNPNSSPNKEPEDGAGQ